MYECDVCGRAVEEARLVEIEGARMVVCEECSKGKEILQEFGGIKQESKQPGSRNRGREETQVVEGYGRIIKAARAAAGLTVKELGEKINEKESTLIRVEKEEMLPDDRLVKRLEKVLGIDLVAQESAGGANYSKAHGEGITFGDSVVIKDKRKKG